MPTATVLYILGLVKNCYNLKKNRRNVLQLLLFYYYYSEISNTIIISPEMQLISANSLFSWAKNRTT